MIDLSILETDDIARELGMAQLEKLALLKHVRRLTPPEPEPTTDEPAAGTPPEAPDDDDEADGGGEYENYNGDEPEYEERDTEPVKLRLPRAERPPAA